MEYVVCFKTKEDLKYIELYHCKNHKEAAIKLKEHFTAYTKLYTIDMDCCAIDLKNPAYAYVSYNKCNNQDIPALTKLRAHWYVRMD